MTPANPPSKRPAYVWAGQWPGYVQLIRELDKLGFTTRELTASPDHEPGMPRPPGPTFVYVKDGDDETALSQFAAASDVVIAVVDCTDRQLISALGEAGVHGIIDLPLRTTTLLIQIELARSKAVYEQKLKTKIALLERTLAARRDIEKATQLLAATRDISIIEAYQILRRTAMTKRKSVAETAQALVQGAENVLSQLT